MSNPYHQLQLPLEVMEPVATTTQVSTPSGYRGLYAFHKYWGKKPFDLILTDPPHSDRVPYLELSEMWNAILGHTADFEKEIVVSNARERQKGLAEYNRAMREFLSLSERVLKNGRCIVILFNARDAPSWEYLSALGRKSKDSLEYRGHFPLSYSAGSVVQDSRKGGLKNDFALVFQKPGLASSGLDQLHKLKCIQGWSDAFPGKQENL